MVNTLDIKNAEKNVFRLAVFDDGIWEIVLGLFFILMSVYPITRASLGPALNAILVLAILLVLAAAGLFVKQRITQPRTGLVKFGAPTKKKIKTANIITGGLVFVTIVLVILGANQMLAVPGWALFPQWLNDLSIDLIFALVIIAFFWLAAYTTGAARFYMHGVLLGAGNFATTVLRVYNDALFGWPVALAGLIITLTGVLVLAKFLQTHPLPNQGVTDVR